MDFLQLGIRPDNRDSVMRLDFVRLEEIAWEVADAEVAGAGFEEIAEGQRAERGVPAGAAAADRQPVAVHQPARDQILRAVDAVVQVYYAPLPVEPLAIGAAVAGAAAVVDIQQGEAAAGPVLVAEAQHGFR